MIDSDAILDAQCRIASALGHGVRIASHRSATDRSTNFLLFCECGHLMRDEHVPDPVNESWSQGCIRGAGFLSALLGTSRTGGDISAHCEAS